jgi:hypothetical protein
MIQVTLSKSPPRYPGAFKRRPIGHRYFPPRPREEVAAEYILATALPRKLPSKYRMKNQNACEPKQRISSPRKGRRHSCREQACMIVRGVLGEEERGRRAVEGA